MPPSSPPRLPCEEENLEPYSSMVVVCSGKIQLQHKASCYRGHSYSNRSNSLQGCTTVQPAHSDLQGGVHLVRECPTEAIRHAEAHPTTHQRGPRRSKVLSARGSWTVAPHPPGRCVPGDATQLFQDADRPNHNAELDVFQSFRTRPQREGPTPLSHVKVVRRSLCGLSSHPPEPLVILLLSRGQPLSL